jgi:hypothetical protein
VPISIAWTQQQFAGDCQRCGARDPVTFLHILSHRFTRITQI